MAEVFISYSQKERALAAPVAARLTELGVEVWYDPRSHQEKASTPLFMKTSGRQRLSSRAGVPKR
jgi:hypothetical protein